MNSFLLLFSHFYEPGMYTNQDSIRQCFFRHRRDAPTARLGRGAGESRSADQSRGQGTHQEEEAFRVQDSKEIKKKGGWKNNTMYKILSERN